jgi:hypothetical protein
MSISLYDQAVTALGHSLGNLKDLLAKAEAYAEAEGIDEKVLLESRMAPTMRDLTFQVQVATDVARKGIARLAGTEAPSWPDDESSFAELRQRIGNALSYFGEFSPDQFEGADEKTVHVPLRDRTHEFTGREYLLFFIIPNVYFHATTTYNLLRLNGMKLGKRDFLGSLTPERD